MGDVKREGYERTKEQTCDRKVGFYNGEQDLSTRCDDFVSSGYSQNQIYCIPTIKLSDHAMFGPMITNCKIPNSLQTYYNYFVLLRKNEQYYPIGLYIILKYNNLRYT